MKAGRLPFLRGPHTRQTLSEALSCGSLASRPLRKGKLSTQRAPMFRQNHVPFGLNTVYPKIRYFNGATDSLNIQPTAHSVTLIKNLFQ